VNVSLNPELERRIAQRVESGEAGSAQALVEQAVESYLDGNSQDLPNEFRSCAEQWRNETGHLSSIERKALHPAYQRIIAMGRPAIPYVLREMQERGGHWFWALRFMGGESPVPEGATVPQAREAWLAWGRKHNYL
jgi:hypothetical protein